MKAWRVIMAGIRSAGIQQEDLPDTLEVQCFASTEFVRNSLFKATTISSRVSRVKTVTVQVDDDHLAKLETTLSQRLDLKSQSENYLLNKFVRAQENNTAFWVALNSNNEAAVLNAIDDYLYRNIVLLAWFIHRAMEYVRSIPQSAPLPEYENMSAEEQVDITSIAKIIFRRMLAVDARNFNAELPQPDLRPAIRTGISQPTVPPFIAESTPPLVQRPVMTQSALLPERGAQQKSVGSQSEIKVSTPSASQTKKPINFPLRTVKGVNVGVDARQRGNQLLQMQRFPGSYFYLQPMPSPAPIGAGAVPTPTPTPTPVLR